MAKRKLVNSILIDAENRMIRPVVHTDLQSIYSLLKVSMIEAVRAPNGDVMYVDEEGRINGTKHAFFLGDKAYAGNGLIVHTDRNGNDANVVSTIEEINAMVSWAEVMD